MTGSGEAVMLVGRDSELARLEAIVDDAVRGHGSVTLIEGEAGIGKTALLQALAARAAAGDATVIRGECDDLTVAPFAPLTRALSITTSSADPERAALAGLLSETATETGTHGHHGPGPHSGVQFRAIEALVALVERLAIDPLVLIIDDLHWADTPTLGAVRAIAKRAPTLPLAVLVSYRADHSSDDLNRLVDEVGRASGNRLTLPPLDSAAIDQLVRVLADTSADAPLLERVGGAAGNPLLISEYVRSWIDTRTDLAARQHEITPQGFRSTVLGRLALQPDGVNDTLRLASVLGTSFSPAHLSVVSKRSAVELAAPLQQAVAAAILDDRGEHLAFRHALVRDAVYEHIPLALRRELHRETARALAAAGVDSLTVARHFALAAAEGSDDLESVEWLRRAAGDVAQRSPATAVELLRHARHVLAPSSPDRNALLAELSVAMAWAGELADAATLAREVLGRRPGPSVSGPLRCALVYALTWQGRAGEALNYTDLDEGEEIDPHDRALLRAEEALARLLAFDLRGAAEAAAFALEQATATGHTLAAVHALTVQAWTAVFGGRPNDATALAQRAVQVAADSPDAEANLAHPRFFPGMPLMFMDRLDEAELLLQAGLKEAEALGLAWSLPLYHAHLGTRRFISGEWDEAIVEFEAALAVADEVGLHVGVIAATMSWLAVIQLHRGDLDLAEETLATAGRMLAATGPQLGMGIVNWARALLLEAKGETDEALGILQFAWDLYMAGGPVTDPWSAMAFVRLCATTGNHERAEGLLPVIDEQAAAADTPFMHGQALRSRGLVERDPDLLVRAVEAYRQCPRPLEIGAACEDAAAALAAAGRLDEAVPLFDEAISAYESLSAERGVQRVRAALRAHGVKRGNRRPQVRATSGWESLTATEQKVVALVAQRLSNPEVAERLFVSRHTIESHLKQVFRKLGVTSRVELAALATARADDSVAP